MKKKILSIVLVMVLIITVFPSAIVNAIDLSNIKAKDIVSGGFFNGVILNDNSLWMWGENPYLGTDGSWDSIYREQTYPIKIMDDVKMASGGRAHTLALKNNGDLYAFGLYGGLGLTDIVGTNTELYRPTKIMDNIKFIDAGGGESCAISNDGSLYVWYTDFRENSSTRPVKMMDNVISAAAGRDCYLAIKNDHTLWGWGDNSCGQLGNGTTEYITEPTKIMDNVKYIDTDNWGWSATAAIKTDNSLWTWGLNCDGQLGNEGISNTEVNGYPCLTTPTKVLDNIKEVNVTCGFMCAVSNSGDLYTWGSNSYGELGNGGLSNTTGQWDKPCLNIPHKILSGVRSAKVGNSHGIAVGNDDTVYVWGAQPENYDNQINVPQKYTANSNIMTLSVGNVLVGNKIKAYLSVMPPLPSGIRVTWASSDNSIATVDANGYVTGKKAGTATITAKASNGMKASCDVKVINATMSGASSEDVYSYYKYSFPNTYSSFGYASEYKIPLERYTQAGISPVLGLIKYNHNWGGSCFGMSSSSALFFKGVLQAKKYSSWATFPINLSAPSTDYFEHKKLREMIELFQVSQNLPYSYEKLSLKDNAWNMVAELDIGNPILLSLRATNKKNTGHCVLIYGYTHNYNTIDFKIYDCSNFVTDLFIQDNKYWFTYNDTKYAWEPSSYCRFDSVHSVYKKMKRYDLESLLSLDEEPQYTYVICPAADMTITNSSGQTSQIIDGNIDGDIEDMSVIPDSYLAENPKYTLIAPKDTYTITGTGNEAIETVIADDNMSVAINSISSVPLTISSDLHDISVQNSEQTNYFIKYTTYDNIFDEMTLSGTTNGTISTSLNNSDITVSGAENINAETTVSKQSIVVSAENLQPDKVIVTVKNEENAVVQIISDNQSLTNSEELPLREQLIVPAYDLESGKYDEAQTLTFTKDDDTLIYYTTDGSAPNENSLIYTSPINVNKSMTIKAIATKYGFSDSECITMEYELPMVNAPVSNFESGEYEQILRVALTNDGGNNIYYTLDGSDPIENGIPYSSEIVILEDTILKAVAIKDGIVSDVIEYEYFIDNDLSLAVINEATDQNGNIVSIDNIDNVSKITMVVQKLSESLTEGDFIIACYDSEQALIGLSTEKHICDKKINVIELPVPESDDNVKTVKIFCWNSLNSLKPLMESYIIK